MFLKPEKLLLILLFAFLPLFCSAESFPIFPMAFWGNASTDGNPLPSGTTIRAYCNDVRIGEIEMADNGIYGYADSTKNKLLVSQCGTDIIFKYLLENSNADMAGGEEIKEDFESGVTIHKNLNFISVQSQSSNTGGASPGNAGGGATLPPVTYRSGDVDQDNKIDILDFNMLMVNWGNNPVFLGADIDGNGKVDIFDFNLLMVNWG